MKAQRYARLLAAILRRYEPPARDVFLSRSGRDEEIELIEQTMARRLRRQRRLRIAASVAATATLLVGAGAAWRLHVEPDHAAVPVAGSAEPPSSREETTPVVVAIASATGATVAAPAGSSTPAVAGRALIAGSRLIVDPSAGAKLSLSTGTHLDVEPGSQLAVVEDGRTQIFALSVGSLHADVAKLNRDERFLVRTSDAEIEVRGTSFLVDVVAPDPECGGGTTTRVTVSEGVVMVRSRGQEEAVRAGERWPRGCRKAAPLVPAATPLAVAGRASKIEPSRAPVAAPSLPKAEPLAAAAPLASPPSRRTPSSTLAEENNLFAEGMFARHSGQLGVALGKMERLLEKYPASHLAESAAAERMRLLRAVDPARAPLAARQYLNLYPMGFARTDAEAIASGAR